MHTGEQSAFLYPAWCWCVLSGYRGEIPQWGRAQPFLPLHQHHTWDWGLEWEPLITSSHQSREPAFSTLCIVMATLPGEDLKDSVITACLCSSNTGGQSPWIHSTYWGACLSGYVVVLRCQSSELHKVFRSDGQMWRQKRNQFSRNLSLALWGLQINWMSCLIKNEHIMNAIKQESCRVLDTYWGKSANLLKEITWPNTGQ